MNNAALIEKFYTSFAGSDAEGMVSCYADDIVFEDPAFGVLKGHQAKSMWRMLLAGAGGGISIQFSNVTATETTGHADWIAVYNFSKTNRKVTNRVSAQFQFKDGKIIRHTDTFDMWKWSKQALGMPGYLLGWSSFMKKKVNGQAIARLNAYIARNK